MTICFSFLGCSLFRQAFVALAFRPLVSMADRTSGPAAIQRVLLSTATRFFHLLPVLVLKHAPNQLDSLGDFVLRSAHAFGSVHACISLSVQSSPRRSSPCQSRPCLACLDEPIPAVSFCARPCLPCRARPVHSGPCTALPAMPRQS